MAAADFAKVNPNIGTTPIFRTRRDMALAWINALMAGHPDADMAE